STSPVREIVALFVERSDDLADYDYGPVMEQIFGRKPAFATLADETKLERFIQAALKLRDPSIASGIRWTEVPRPDAFYKKGFKLLGQAYTPDSEVFQELVYDKVLKNEEGHLRFLPKGLDVMAALGSATAEALLREQGDFKFARYAKQLKELKAQFAKLSQQDRLTDEKWQQMLQEGREPPLPRWTEEFIVQELAEQEEN
ncbi:MAG: DUF3160 domain-containing protein, partial [Acidobacteria bacterium]|nr:DUF3160 domain-containing protein [Acidobacteriota bacterium]